jgi:hypothetical protein
MAITDDLRTTVAQLKRTIAKNEGKALEDLQSAMAQVIESSSVASLADQYEIAFNLIYYDPNYNNTQLKAFKLVAQKQLGSFELAVQDIEYLGASKLFISSSLLGDDIDDEILEIFDVSTDGKDGSTVTNIPASARGRGPRFRP